jgi:hypothetical protein
MGQQVLLGHQDWKSSLYPAVGQGHLAEPNNGDPVQQLCG